MSPINACMSLRRSALFQEIVWCLFSANPSLEPDLMYVSSIGTLSTNISEIYIKTQTLQSNCVWKCGLQNYHHLFIYPCGHCIYHNKSCCLFRMPRDRVCICHHQCCSCSLNSPGLQRGKCLYVFLWHQTHEKQAHNAMGVGRMQWQCQIWTQILARFYRCSGKGARLTLHHQPAQ